MRHTDISYGLRLTSIGGKAATGGIGLLIASINMDVFEARDRRVNRSDGFWQIAARRSISQTYLFGGNLTQVAEDGGQRTDYYLLSVRYLIRCKGKSLSLHKRANINWKRLESLQPNFQSSCIGFKISFSRGSQVFYTKNAGEHASWMHWLSMVCVMSGLESKYALGEALGTGTCSVVYRATSRTSHQTVAVKLVPKHSAAECLKEVDIMRRQDHEAILKVLGVFDTPDHVAVVLEYAAGGSLYQFILRHQSIDEASAQTCTVKLLQGIEHCHQLSIVHRDLRLGSVLLAVPDDLASVKITNFKMACDLEVESLKKQCGTPGYIAPEVILNRNQSNKLDVFSAGVILHILLSGKAPFEGRTSDEVFQSNAACRIDLGSDYWAKVSEAAKDLVKKMMTKEPLQRPEVGEVLNHSWLNKVLSGVPPLLLSPAWATVEHICKVKEAEDRPYRASLGGYLGILSAKGPSHSARQSPRTSLSPLDSDRSGGGYLQSKVTACDIGYLLQKHRPEQPRSKATRRRQLWSR
jgi:serine/threonine protein kinase